VSKIILDNQDILVKRLEVPKNHQLSLLKDIMIEPGTKEDWLLLQELHYKAGTEGIGPRRWKITLYGKTIGVGVMTVPKMLLSGRNELFKRLRPNVDGKDNRMINKYRAEWINAHMCTNSRLVIDTMYRGAGIAYRAQNLMMRMTEDLYIEFQSSMSKFNPFAEKAGIKFAPPKRASNYQRGLEFFRRWFDSIPTDCVGIMQEIDAMPPKVQEKCIAEMRKFYYTFSSMEKSGNNRKNGTSRVDGLTVDKLLKNTQQLVFASPLYGVYENPDAFLILKESSHKIPHRVSIMAFDCQKTDEPLNFDLIKERGYAIDFKAD
jgi:uncharacterized protein